MYVCAMITPSFVVPVAEMSAIPDSGRLSFALEARTFKRRQSNALTSSHWVENGQGSLSEASRTPNDAQTQLHFNRVGRIVRVIEHGS